MFTLSEMTETVARLQTRLRDSERELCREIDKRRAAETARDQYRSRTIDLDAKLQLARKRILELEDESVTIKRQRGW